MAITARVSTGNRGIERPYILLSRRRRCATAASAADHSPTRKRSAAPALVVALFSLVISACERDKEPVRNSDGLPSSSEPLAEIFVVPDYGAFLDADSGRAYRTGIDGLTTVRYDLPGPFPPDDFMASFRANLVSLGWSELENCLRNPAEKCGTRAGWLGTPPVLLWTEWWVKGNEAVCIDIHYEGRPTPKSPVGLAADVDYYDAGCASPLIAHYRTIHGSDDSDVRSEHEHEGMERPDPPSTEDR